MDKLEDVESLGPSLVPVEGGGCPVHKPRLVLMVNVGISPSCSGRETGTVLGKHPENSCLLRASGETVTPTSAQLNCGGRNSPSGIGKMLCAGEGAVPSTCSQSHVGGLWGPGGTTFLEATGFPSHPAQTCSRCGALAPRMTNPDHGDGGAQGESHSAQPAWVSPSTGIPGRTVSPEFMCRTP